MPFRNPPTILIIPSGADTGARIVIDGTTGDILIYNSAGLLKGVLTAAGRIVGSTVLPVGFFTGALDGISSDEYFGFDVPNAGVIFKPGAQFGIAYNQGKVTAYASGSSANDVVGELQIRSPFATDQTAINDSAQILMDSRSHDGVTLKSQIAFTGDQFEFNGNGANVARLRLNSRCLCTRIANISAAATTSGSDTTTSATYVNCAGTGSQTSVSITKDYDSTRSKLLIRFLGTAYTVTAASEITFGININSVDNDLIHTTINATSQHMLIGAERFVTGLAAGTYTCQMRWKRPGGTGTLTRDTFDWLSLTVEEVPA